MKTIKTNLKPKLEDRRQITLQITQELLNKVHEATDEDVNLSAVVRKALELYIKCKQHQKAA